MEDRRGDELAELDGLAVRLIGHAVMAKAYGDAILRDPALSGGFGRLAERHCAALVTLSDEIRGAADRMGGAAPVAFGHVSK